MRLPYLQVAMEVIEQAAPELSVGLECDEEKAGWGLVKLFKWALGRCPEDRPPSAGAVVKGKNAARLIAQAAGFGGSPDAFVSACEAIAPDPILERVGDGIRICGLDRYDAAWRKSNPAKWMEWREKYGIAPEPEQNRSESAPNPPRNGAEPAPQKKTQMQTQTHSSSQEEELRNQPRVIEPPTAEVNAWTGSDFYRFAQGLRQRAGLIAEKWPNLRELDDWWSGCLMTPGVTPKAMCDGFYRFGQSKHWEKTDTPYPFAAFKKHWASWVRAEVASGAAA